MDSRKRWDQCSLEDAIEKVANVSYQAVANAIEAATARGDTATVEVIEAARAFNKRERYLERSGREAVLSKEAARTSLEASRLADESEFNGYESRSVVGFEGVWSVTPCGKVFSHISRKWLSPSVCKAGKGYLQLNDRKRGSRFVHRVVAEAYIPNHEGKRTVNHKDGNTRNNSVSNLEWATHKENTQHAIVTGLWNPGHAAGYRGVPKKLNSTDVQQIRELLAKGSSQSAIGRLYGVSQGTIWSIATGRIWKHSTQNKEQY